MTAPYLPESLCECTISSLASFTKELVLRLKGDVGDRDSQLRTLQCEVDAIRKEIHER